MAVRMTRNLIKNPPFYLPSSLNISLRNDIETFLRPLGCSWYHINEVHGSSIARSTRKNGNGKSEANGRLHQFRRVMKQFVSGSKDLGSDVKRLVSIRKKLRASGKDWDALTVDETLHLHQVRYVYCCSCCCCCCCVELVICKREIIFEIFCN